MRAHVRQLERDERRELVRETRANLAVEFGNVPWRDMVDVLAVREDPDDVVYEAAMSIVLLHGWHERINFRLYWQWVERGRVDPPPELIAGPEPPPPVQRDLRNLALDPQNVHTRAVSTQTNSAMDKLLTTEVPKEQQTEKAVVRAWTAHVTSGWIDMLRVLNDINKWFNTKTCRSDNDQLYRRLLRGLVATINKTDDEMRPELFKRLWEECRESVSMCCEGHISRLCNVMVGFDDAFKPPVSIGEILQQKMAAIGGLDVPTEMKHTHAIAVFDELGVPAEQRQAWLDAF